MSTKLLTYRAITKDDFLHHTEAAAKRLFRAIELESKLYDELLVNNQIAGDFYKSEVERLEEDETISPFEHNWAFGRYLEAGTQQKLIQFSVDVLSTGVLQIAKQGIALLLEEHDKFSKGRLIGTQHLSKVIWHARNQAMHWDEGLPDPANLGIKKYTFNCFKTIASDMNDDAFDLTKDPSCKATRVLALLGWANYPSYLQDMESILQ